MVKDTLLYDRLNISPNASKSEIKKAYRKLSLKWHPDKNKDKEEATKKFQEISEAYNILSDDQKRNQYDSMGYDMMNDGNGMNFDPSDIFEKFFNGFGGPDFGGSNSMPGFGFPFNFNNNSKEYNEDNCYIKLSVTLDQIYNEEKVKVSYNQKIYCSKCDGTGSKSKKNTVCQKCEGKGKILGVRRMGPMVQQIVQECRMCNGTGSCLKDNDRCNTCDGNSFIVKSKTINLPLRNGLKNGNKIKLDKKGHYLKNGKTDLIIEIIELPHKKFKRSNIDLFIDMKIKLYQSLIGFDKLIIHLDGRKLHINNNEIIKDGDVKIIKGEGMNSINSKKKGDLYIKFTIDYPDLSKLTKEESNLLKVLLAKTEEKELDNETNIIENQSNFVKRELENIREEEYYEEEQSNTNECVHQ